MAHQLDRIEEMLTQLVGPQDSRDMVTREHMMRWTIDLFGALINNQKIEAIKAHRALTGQGLFESKKTIERLYEILSKQNA